ncbi:hypothetical protein SSBR45G_04220 [Bradyrhizobium sp. SSBR45G]|nr:hypothetical protein SSBR45G_04220 [Bradyrhizobium sp. SSBR45G]GLH82699.1 hypothetical protein SSBR45R_01590 [Bradyrhizobium sp. SSBR45R]
MSLGPSVPAWLAACQAAISSALRVASSAGAACADAQTAPHKNAAHNTARAITIKLCTAPIPHNLKMTGQIVP